jgi:hypothetical protein
MLALVTAASALVAADHYTYTYDKEKKAWVQTSQTPSVVNSSEACMFAQCVEVDCNDCHQSMSARRLSADQAQMRSHLDVHFSKAEMPLAESRRITVSGLSLTRVGGRLVMTAADGARYRFPAGSRIIRGRNGQALFVISPGSMPPQLVR